MKELNNITLVLVDCKNYSEALLALRKSLKHIKVARVIFFTDVDFDAGEAIEVIKIDKINSKDEYSHFIIKELYKYFQTDFVWIIQADGYILNMDCFLDEFLEYDGIGAKWIYQDNRNNFNGGFSIRSKKLQTILGTDPFIEITSPEDEIIGRLYRSYLIEKHGIKFPPDDLCDKFAYELNEPVSHTVGFHGNFWPPFKDHVVIKRDGACGDVIMCEPLIQYYHDQGYQVVLDTQQQFMSLFFQHPFKVKHLSEMNPKIKPIKEIDLNFAYELKPQIPVLKAYCEKAGIDMPLRNSRLNINITPESKLFNKCVLIHADSTGIPHRDVNDLDWDIIVKYLQLKGYLVFQCGKRTHKQIAPNIHTETLEMLMYVVQGADLVIGLDSGICQIAVALGVPTVIMAGSVDLRLRYNDFTKIQAIQGKCPSKEHEFCYHKSIGSTTGAECVYNRYLPPCTFFDKHDIINAIKELI